MFVDTAVTCLPERNGPDIHEGIDDERRHRCQSERVMHCVRCRLPLLTTVRATHLRIRLLNVVLFASFAMRDIVSTSRKMSTKPHQASRLRIGQGEVLQTSLFVVIGSSPNWLR